MERTMKTIGAFEAKTHLSRILREVELNKEEIIIQKHNRTVACIVPCNSPVKKHSDAVDIISGFKEIRKNVSVSQTSITELINDGRKR
jgi:antitoxin (DNA-binding transcriptional repressor) of toxin-antitoxin stability system